MRKVLSVLLFWGVFSLFFYHFNIVAIFSCFIFACITFIFLGSEYANWFTGLIFLGTFTSIFIFLETPPQDLLYRISIFLVPLSIPGVVYIENHNASKRHKQHLAEFIEDNLKESQPLKKELAKEIAKLKSSSNTLK